MTEPATTPPRPRLTDTARGQNIFVSLWVLGTILALGLWVGSFLLGQAVGADGEPPGPEVVISEDSGPQFPVLGQPAKPPGSWAWDELRGGECLTGFSDSFAEVFQVVSCSSVHTAQLVHAELLSRDRGESYPGDTSVLAQARDVCDVRDLISREVAEEFSDLRTAYSYPVNQEQWDVGERGVYCFVYSEGGDSFRQSLR